MKYLHEDQCDVNDEGRTCCRCGEFKPWSDFEDSTRRGMPRMKTRDCKECRERVRDYDRQECRSPKRLAGRGHQIECKKMSPTEQAYADSIKPLDRPLTWFNLPPEKFAEKVKRMLE